MKKFLTCAALSIALLCGGATVVASAEVASGTECDEVFAATVGELIDCQENAVGATRKTLYDINVDPLGFVYEFTADGTDGYAVFLWEDEKFIPQEVIPEGASPYAQTEGKCVYVCSYTYLEYADGEYVDLNNGIILSPEAVSLMAENAVYGEVGIMPLATTNVTISFKSKDKHEYFMSIQPPKYNVSPYLSACACVAGANIIGFYDRYYPNLIANYEPGYTFMGALYFYYGQSSEIDAVIKQLYVDMGTTDSGTTQTQFINGMSKYCSRAGYNFGYTSLMSGGKLNYSAAITYMEQYNQPIALFLSGYNVANITEGDSQDDYGYYYFTDNHMMVGFGYRYISYTYSSGSTETFNFLYVASGIQNATAAGYYNINFSSTTLNDALAINIY